MRVEQAGDRWAPVSDTTLDARGLKCPLPVLRARKAMQSVAPGAVLRVLATDPGTVQDFQAFCAATGHELVEHAEEEGEFRFRIRKLPAQDRS
jgi:tRNA 2-thiouridine synthesizing protein A